MEWKTDARGVKTTYEYDALNRITRRSYAYTGGGSAPAGYGATPAVVYRYDGAQKYMNVNLTYNFKGRLTSVISPASETHYNGFDAMGRVRWHQQVIDPEKNFGGTFYSTEYGYNLMGGLVTQKYPSGKVVTTEYDAAGRIAGVKNQATGNYYAGAAPADASNRMKYAVHGGVEAMRLGNNLWEHTTFNSRLQPEQIGLGTASTNSNVLKLDYGYGTTNNSGNVQSQTITLPGLTLAQTYSYDALNRLETAAETNATAPCLNQDGVATSCWKQKFAYDVFGNRRFNTSETTPNVLGENPTISEVNNRIVQAGYEYDAAGNLLCDPAHPCSGTSNLVPYYVYDAENRMVMVGGGANPYSGTAATYSYDGDGKRVKKVVGIVMTVFVYDATGQLVAEYANQATGSGTSYLTGDHLGSTRVVTDSNGGVKSRHDFLPFGEEISSSIGNRHTVASPGYNLGGVRQKFTGYERDSETDFDFAQARMYASTLGRFTTTDQPFNDQFESNPQSWNLYSYVRNNPLNMIDPTGEMGDFYHRHNGAYLGTDGIDDDKVYAAEVESSTYDKETNRTHNRLKNVEELSISHPEFKKQAATVYGESSAYRMKASEELKKEMGAIATVHQINKIAYGDKSQQAKIFNDTPLEDRKGKMQMANWAVINAVTGGFDYSYGATNWDGAEQSLYSDSDKRTSVPNPNGRGTWELHKNTIGWSISDEHYAKWKQNVGRGFKAPQTSVARNGRIGFDSTAVYGRTIFWRRR